MMLGWFICCRDRRSSMTPGCTRPGLKLHIPSVCKSDSTVHNTCSSKAKHAQQDSTTYGSAMPEQLPGRREMVRLQQRRVIVPELHYTADKGCQAGVSKGVLRDDGGALAQQTADQQALSQSRLLPLLTYSYQHNSCSCGSYSHPPVFTDPQFCCSGSKIPAQALCAMFEDRERLLQSVLECWQRLLG